MVLVSSGGGLALDKQEIRELFNEPWRCEGRIEEVSMRVWMYRLLGVGLAVWMLFAIPNSGASRMHDYGFYAFMRSGEMVPGNDSQAVGWADMRYNTHAYMLWIDVFVRGIGLEDLAEAGPNGTPIHIHLAEKGQIGPPVIDLGYFGDFVEQDGGLYLQLEEIEIGGQQGELYSELFENVDALWDANLYIVIHTNAFPDGEIRGQISWCRGDYNRDNEVDTLDFLEFLNEYSTGTTGGDYNIDGRVNTLDFVAFLNDYNDGCPF